MTNRTAETSPLVYARVAGGLWLILAIFGGFAFVSVSSLLAPGEAAATVSNIMASESLFRIAILSDLFSQTVFIVLVLVLYKLLKPVNNFAALLMVVFVIVSVSLQSISALNQIAVLFLLSGADYLRAFPTDQLPALVLLFLNMREAGFEIIAQIYFGLWLLPLGYLVYKSGFLPRILAVLLIIAGFGYLTSVVTFFLFPNFDTDISQFTFIGEVTMLLWLLIKGVNVEKWEKRALESA